MSLRFSNKRAGGKCRIAFLFHAVHSWSALPQHYRWAARVVFFCWIIGGGGHLSETSRHEILPPQSSGACGVLPGHSDRFRTAHVHGRAALDPGDTSVHAFEQHSRFSRAVRALRDACSATFTSFQQCVATGSGCLRVGGFSRSVQHRIYS